MSTLTISLTAAFFCPACAAVDVADDRVAVIGCNDGDVIAISGALL